MSARIVRFLLIACADFALAGMSGDLIAQQLSGSPEGGQEHPLAPVLQWARQESANMERGLADYSAIVVSRERLGGSLSDFESVFVKIRHQPFSVYAHFLAPESHKGDEAIYVEGRNGGKLLGHTTGVTGRLMGTVALDPTGPTAMKGQRHPMTELGLLNLCQRFVHMARNDLRYGESQVRYPRDMKVNDRLCNCIEVVHPVPRREFQFHMLRMFVDEQLKVPIRYEQYDWPAQPGAPAVLLEEYTYVNLKLNNGFGDIDFDPRNPNYAFP
ncbi:MAG: DUF1571 domain-containing protein [Thermoguttaceae bacterium]